MANELILGFITKGKSNNISDNEIKDGLKKGGWSDAEIQEGFVAYAPAGNLLPPASIRSSAVGSHGMWDAFEHILLFISLYVMSSSMALMMHMFVDKWLPGTLQADDLAYYSSLYPDFQVDLLRGYIAAIIVSLPLFLFFFLNVTKRTFTDASMRNLRSRKMLIYITLIMSFLIMLSHVIQVLFTFISGNVDWNTFFHLLVTLWVNGIIFIYYVLQVKHDRRLNA